MTGRNLIAAAIAILVAAGCVRLGLWQLERLAQRRTLNSGVEKNMMAPPVPIAQLPRDTALTPYRRVLLTGVFDFDHEIALTGKSRQGSPGVHILTPFRIAGSDRGVLVNRGWVYAPDAASIELSRWFEPESTTVLGYVEPSPRPGSDDPRAASNPRAWRRLDFARLAGILPYPIEPFSVVALDAGETAVARTAPQRLPLPLISEGPHKGYAFQWFSFAVIAIVGVSALIWQDVRERRRRTDALSDPGAYDS